MYVLANRWNFKCQESAVLLSLCSYHHGPVPLLSQHYCTGDEIMAAISALHEEMAEYKPRLAQVRGVGPLWEWGKWWDGEGEMTEHICFLPYISGQALTSKAAGQAIAALSPGGSMMQEVGQIPADRTYPTWQPMCLLHAEVYHLITRGIFTSRQ